MKQVVLFLILFSGYALADPLSEVNAKKLKEIAELFRSDSGEEAIRQLKLHENMLSEAINDAKDADAYVLLGRAYFYAEMDSNAKDALNSALLYDSSLADAHFFLGLISTYAGDLDEAERSYRSAIEQDDLNDAYFLELGRILERKGDPKSALVEYRNALAVDEMNFSANFNSANIHANDGSHGKAEKHYLAALKKAPDDLDCNYNLGQLYQNTDQHHLAIEYFSKVVERDASEWRAVAKVIQENEALGEIAARDKAIDKIYALWRGGAIIDLQEQGFFVREQRRVDAGRLLGLEYFELKGERARKFVFKLHDIVSGDNTFDFSLGSYDETTQISRELGEIGADERIYHLDGYAPNGSHYTYAFFRAAPEYEVVRELVLKVLAGQHEAISGTTPSM